MTSHLHKSIVSDVLFGFFICWLYTGFCTEFGFCTLRGFILLLFLHERNVVFVKESANIDVYNRNNIDVCKTI